jgi:hypothetical protein
MISSTQYIDIFGVNESGTVTFRLKLPRQQTVNRNHSSVFHVQNRRLHKEELYNLYASQNIIRVIKLRRMVWAGHVTCMGEMRSASKI